ncbi:MAG TPA: hypothetical protein VN641_14770 [Urbifossiella sp.]|nr:hypothetical protein [Urbifossiella sp.]
MQLKGNGFVYHYPADFDERAAIEMTDKGYVAGGSVEIAGKARFPVAFFTPNRLRQELELAMDNGESVLAEEGLAIIAEITPTAILRASEELVNQHFFDHLKPLLSVVSNGAMR